MKGLYIFAASGHAKVLIEIAELNDLMILGLVDDDYLKTKLFDYRVDQSFIEKDQVWVIGLGNNSLRKRIVSRYLKEYITLIHPSVNISKRSSVAEGTVIMAGVSINSSVDIGKHCIINTNVSVDHDCIIEDFVHLSPNAALGGNVTVGEGTHIGIGDCVIQGIKIGKWCTIGAGAVVIKNVPDGATVVGNPGRIIKQKSIKDL